MDIKKRKYSENTPIKKKRRIYNTEIILIQSFFRKKLAYNKYIKLFDKYSCNINNKEFSNITTLIGKKLKNIKQRYRYTLLEQKSWYFFDLRELYKSLQNNNKNPYTNNIIQSRYIVQINRLCNKLLSKNYSLIIKNPIPEESTKTIQIAAFINKLHSYNLYTTIDQLNDLTNSEMFYIITQLIYIYECEFKLNDIYKELNDENTDIVLYFINIINHFINHNNSNMESIYTFTATLIDNIYEYGYDLCTLNITFIAVPDNDIPFIFNDL